MLSPTLLGLNVVVITSDQGLTSLFSVYFGVEEEFIIYKEFQLLCLILG